MNEWTHVFCLFVWLIADDDSRDVVIVDDDDYDDDDDEEGRLLMRYDALWCGDGCYNRTTTSTTLCVPCASFSNEWLIKFDSEKFWPEVSVCYLSGVFDWPISMTFACLFGCCYNMATMDIYTHTQYINSAWLGS